MQMSGRNAMKKKYRFMMPVLAAFVIVMLCGASLFGAEVVIDTEKHPVYEYISASDLLTKSAAAEEAYRNRYFLITGEVDSVAADGSSITLTGGNGVLRCECDIGVYSDAAACRRGDKVALYGRYTVGLFDNERHFTVYGITAPPANYGSHEMYYTGDGSSFDRTAAKERTLSDGHVVYYIPAKWQEIEIDIRENKLGMIEGREYVLNKTPGSSDAEPELLFICYFDKKLLKEQGDVAHKARDTEKAIVKNIEGKVTGFFPSKTAYTYYDSTYKYYLGKYSDPAQLGRGYHTEYVFCEDGDRGIIVLLYVYREEKHLSDVMFAARFIETR